MDKKSIIFEITSDQATYVLNVLLEMKAKESLKAIDVMRNLKKLKPLEEGEENGDG